MLLGATELVGTCYVQQTREAKACSLMSTSLGPPGLAFLLPVTGTCVEFSASLPLPSAHLSDGGQKVRSGVHLSCLPHGSRCPIHCFRLPLQIARSGGGGGGGG